MLAYSCILHVESVDQEYVAVEAETSAEDQEGELQDLEAAEQVEEQDLSDYTNPDQQPGKHRFIYPRVFHKFKFGASTGSSTPESFISLSLVQAPEAFNPVSYTSILSSSLTLCSYMCIKLIGVAVIPRMHVVGLIYPILDNSLINIMLGPFALLSAIGSIEVECF